MARVISCANNVNYGAWLKWLDVGFIAARSTYNTYENSILELQFIDDLTDLLLSAKNLQQLVLPRADIDLDAEYRPRCSGAMAIASRTCPTSLRHLSMLAEVTPRDEAAVAHMGHFRGLYSLELAFWADCNKCKWLRQVPAWDMPELWRLHWKGPGIGLSFCHGSRNTRPN
jgi:hypothetical protein